MSAMLPDKQVHTTQLQVPLPTPKGVAHGLRSAHYEGTEDRGEFVSKLRNQKKTGISEPEATCKRRIAMEFKVHPFLASSPIKPNCTLSNPIDRILTEYLENTQ